MQFKPMGVDVAGWNFGLDKLNRELDRHQFIRELTQNSIEAIKQTESGVGDITWELYPLPISDKPINKLCCIDNGIGMTGPELVEYINTGFKSGKERGHKANFGIGAKVSALTFNKAGVLYMSWKDGEGAMIHLAQDDKTGFYGLNQLERPDGTFGWWAPIGNERKPDRIKRHGTVVVLMGDKPEQDTFERPEGSHLPAASWVGAYLQRKYLRFPEGITVRAREQGVSTKPGLHKHDRALRIIRGQGPLLRAYSEHAGEILLNGVKVRYWLLDMKLIGSPAGFSNRPSAHIAALYKDELHEVRTGSQGGYQRLASFGVTVGQSRIVLYVEPDPETVEANLTRQHLMVNGERLPWDYYAVAFSENMPDAIKNMMQELLDSVDARSNMDKITKRLKEIARMLESARYLPNENGDVRADTPTIGGSPRELGRETEDHQPSGGTGGLKEHIYRLIKTASGESAKKKKARPKQPEVVWVSSKDTPPTREQGFLEERAAFYDPAANRIVASKDFDNFQNVLKAIKAAVPQANGAGEAAARLEFETVLVETVMNILAREGSKHWSEEEIKRQYEPEALTNAVNHTFHIVNAARAEVARQKKQANEQLAKMLAKKPA